MAQQSGKSSKGDTTAQRAAATLDASVVLVAVTEHDEQGQERQKRLVEGMRTNTARTSHSCPQRWAVKP